MIRIKWVHIWVPSVQGNSHNYIRDKKEELSISGAKCEQARNKTSRVMVSTIL